MMTPAERGTTPDEREGSRMTGAFKKREKKGLQSKYKGGRHAHSSILMNSLSGEIRCERRMFLSAALFKH